MKQKIPQEYTFFIEALIEDEDLRQWFTDLKSHPENLQHAQISKMCNELARAGEDDQLVKLVQSLEDRRVYQAIEETLKSLID